MIIGSPLYLGIIWLISAICIGITCLISKDKIRIAGAGSWIVVLLFSPLAGLIALPIASIAAAGDSYALPLVAIAFIGSIPVIHWLLPALAPDFQTENMGATLMLCVWVGIAVLVASMLSGQADAIIPMSIFQGPGGIPTE